MRRRLRKALETPFPERWRSLLTERSWWWTTLGEQERIRLEELIRMFLASKSFEGTRGFEPTEEMRLMIAAQACLLILNHDFGLYDDVTSIIVSPSAVRHRGPRRLDGGIESDEGAMLAGQAMLHGPVLITWDSASNQARHPERGHNVVFHEFAHKLDMRNGAPDGVPPLSAELKGRWEPTLRSLLEELREATAAGLDSYGATNPAELLAVATEAFFDTPSALRSHQPELYALLADFYRQDPAERGAR
ncbi:MAG: zinc-dependent peptidase [Acidimicrobiia bacterium]|nr:zinc-dependent peptidase [Acidimicrobiia bacterium]